MTWHGLHVYHYDEAGLDSLVLGGVRPLFARIGGPAYHVRHWLRGPHLRLAVRTDADTFRDTVVPAAHEIIGGYLSERPSAIHLEPDALEPMHRRLAELEGETGPLFPWHPDNSIRVEPMARRVEVLGSDEAAELLADFYAGTTEIAFAMTERVLAGERRLGMAFDLMIATAHALSGVDITDAFVSFRSHAEGFLAGFTEGQGLRPAWDRHTSQHVAALANRVAAIVSTVDGTRDVVPGVRDWVAAVRPYRARAARLIEQGLLTVAAPGGPVPATLSTFHRSMVDNPYWAEIESADWFRLYRVMLNYTYLHLTRLGVRPAERFLLCHLAAAAVEHRYGVSADAVLTRYPGAMSEVLP